MNEINAVEVSNAFFRNLLGNYSSNLDMDLLVQEKKLSVLQL